MTERALHIEVFTPADVPADKRAIAQLATCMRAGDAVGGVLCADHHVGYSQPIGGAVAYPNHISPSGVGYDIGCGNKAVATSLHYADVRNDLPRIMDEVQRRISFGIGQPNDEEVKDHPVFDRISKDFPLERFRNRLIGNARKQLGTVGAGNHYVDLFREEGTDRIWIGVHFGSRGFGHKVASGFLALAQGLAFDDHAQEGEMDAPPTLLDVRAPLGHLYIEAMNIAGEYAYAGRDVVVDKVLEILGSPAVLKEVHNHHNFAWREAIYDTEAWVVRKGCTPLYPGQEGFVGGSMGENAVIIQGSEDSDWNYQDERDATNEEAAAALFSAPHGAGRVMSRTQAAGKKRRRSQCSSCGFTQKPHTPAIKGRCPECGAGSDKVRRVWVQETEGKIDWDRTRDEIASAGIELRGGAADEAPLAYKRLPAVLEAHEPYVKITHQLRPIGVVMAGADTYDPFKD